MKRSEIVLEGKQCFLEAEDAVDAALEKLMSCGVKLSQLRRTARLSKIVGQTAMTTLISSISKVGGGMEDLVEMHGQLTQVSIAMGCRTVLEGGDNDKPIFGEHGSETGGGTVSNVRTISRRKAAA